MQFVIKDAKKLRLFFIENLFKNEIELKLDKPIVSFTFDDFPKTAFTNGAKILEKYNVKGTYYISFGLINSLYEIGETCSAEDVKELIDKGHDIGCHTYSHVCLKNFFALRQPHLGLKKYREDIVKNKKAYQKITSNRNLNHFAYPHGVISIKAKIVSGEYFKTCRSTIEGINSGILDLNSLKANNLYSASKPIEEIISLINKNIHQRGWLIFYTHDVSIDPSPWGCNLQYFEEIVKRASETNEVLSVDDVYRKVCMRR